MTFRGGPLEDPEWPVTFKFTLCGACGVTAHTVKEFRSCLIQVLTHRRASVGNCLQLPSSRLHAFWPRRSSRSHPQCQSLRSCHHPLTCKRILPSQLIPVNPFPQPLPKSTCPFPPSHPHANQRSSARISGKALVFVRVNLWPKHRLHKTHANPIISPRKTYSHLRISPKLRTSALPHFQKRSKPHQNCSKLRAKCSIAHFGHSKTRRKTRFFRLCAVLRPLQSPQLPQLNKKSPPFLP